MNAFEPFDCQKLQDLVSRFSLVEACDQIKNGMLRLSTPFRYPDGSAIDLFLSPRPDAANLITLTDLAQTTAYLLDVQVKPWTTKKRQKQIQDICETLKVNREGGELLIRVDASKASEVATMIARLGQACLRMADMALTQRLPVSDSFGETFEEFVAEIQCPYEVAVELPGRYLKPVSVDYRVKGRNITSLVQTLSTSNAAAAHGLSTEIFTRWYDLESSKNEHQFLTIYDTTNNAIRDVDLKRLEDVSLVLGFPADNRKIVDCLAA